MFGCVCWCGLGAMVVVKGPRHGQATHPLVDSDGSPLGLVVYKKTRDSCEWYIGHWTRAGQKNPDFRFVPPPFFFDFSKLRFLGERSRFGVSGALLVFWASSFRGF